MLPALLLGLAPLALALGAAARPASYAVWAADSAIARKQGNGLSGTTPKVDYTHGEFWFALRRLYEKTGNASYVAYVQAGADNVVSSNGTVGGGYKCVAPSGVKGADETDGEGVPGYPNTSLTRSAPARRSSGCTCSSALSRGTRRLTVSQIGPHRPGQVLHRGEAVHGCARRAAADARGPVLAQAGVQEPGCVLSTVRSDRVLTSRAGWLDGVYMGDVFYANYMQTWYPYNNTAWSTLPPASL